MSAPDWSCPDGELVLTVQQAQNRPLWLATRRQGIGSSDAAALMGQSPYTNEFEVWLDKTGRLGERPVTLAMEMGQRMEAAVAEKFADTFGLEIRRRGMLRCKHEPLLLVNVDRLASDGYVLECKFVNGFMKMPAMDNGYFGVPAHWYWQLIALLLGTGRKGVYLAVGIGNRDFQVRSIDRDDPQVQEDMGRLLEKIGTWWPQHVVAGEVPTMGQPVLPEEVLEKDRFDFLIPEQGWEIRDRLREIRETAKALKEEGDEIKAKLQAEAGGARWIYADGRPILEFNPRAGRASFQKARLFQFNPLDGVQLAQRLAEMNLGGDLLGMSQEDIVTWLSDYALTEEQFTTRGKASTALLIVGDADD